MRGAIGGLAAVAVAGCACGWWLVGSVGVGQGRRLSGVVVASGKEAGWSYDLSLGEDSEAEGRYNVAIGYGERVKGGECKVRVGRLDAGTRYLLHDLGASSWNGVEGTMRAIEQHCGYGSGYLEGLVIVAMGPDGRRV